MDNNSICNRIFQERKRLGMTQDELGQKIGISGNAYRDIENGKTKLVSKRVEEIASAFGITPEEIIFGYPVPSEDIKSKLEETEKELKKRISELEAEFKLAITEKEGEISLLKTALENKEKIRGLLKEIKSVY